MTFCIAAFQEISRDSEAGEEPGPRLSSKRHGIKTAESTR